MLCNSQRNTGTKLKRIISGSCIPEFTPICGVSTEFHPFYNGKLATDPAVRRRWHVGGGSGWETSQPVQTPGGIKSSGNGSEAKITFFGDCGITATSTSFTITFHPGNGSTESAKSAVIRFFCECGHIPDTRKQPHK